METIERKQRVIVYVDGFNFYYGLKSKKWRRFYWLDLVAFFDSLIKPHQELIQVHYFSAIPFDKDKHDRQDLLFNANKLNPKFALQLGKFLKKNLSCPSCRKPYQSFEEKETDVRIATQMIHDVVTNACDISILVSADSDLIPPIEFIRSYKTNHKIFVYFPPGRFSFNLKNLANQTIKLETRVTQFENAILPEEIELPSGYIIKRPARWK